MNRKILILTAAAAALTVGQSWAQKGFGEGGSCKKAPPGSGEQLCIDQRAWYDQPGGTPFTGVPSSGAKATATATPPFTAPPADVAATDIAPTSVALNDAQPAPDAELNPPAPTPAPSDVSATPPAAPTPAAPTPAASDVSVTTASSMAYASIANGPNGVYIAKVGNYPMSAYAMPPRPLPYDQVEAYLSAPKSKQLAQNWWAGMDQLAEAETAPASNVSATVDEPIADQPDASHASIPGDTASADLQSDVGAPVAPPAVSGEAPATPDTAQAAVDDGTSDGPAYYY